MKQDSAYEIRIPLFEGPFDLLLFFIERDELDIYDIPIATITNDFLDYVHQLETLNVDIASEFILVASTLMRIKVKMLLPRREVNEKGEELDPREELVRHLLDYKRYKSVVSVLAEMEESRSFMHPRGNAEEELKSLLRNNETDMELQSFDLFKLLKVYQRVINQYKQEQEKPRHTIVQYPYTLEGQKEIIIELVNEKSKISFLDLIAQGSDKIATIFNFLAILELLQLGKINLVLGEGYNNFWIENQQLIVN